MGRVDIMWVRWLVGGERCHGAGRSCGVGECRCRGELTGVCCLGRCRSVASHVLFKGAVVAEGVVSCGGLRGGEAVEASWGTVARYGWVRAAAMAGVVVGLQVPALSTDPAPFVRGWVSGAGVYIVG